MGHSGAARAGMVNFTETAAVEWAPVRVNAVAPGLHRLQRHGPLSARDARHHAREMRKTVPLRPARHRERKSRRRSCSCSARRRRSSAATCCASTARRRRRAWAGPCSCPTSRRRRRDAVRPFEGFHRARRRGAEGIQLMHGVRCLPWNAQGAERAAAARRHAGPHRELRALEERAAAARPGSRQAAVRQARPAAAARARRPAARRRARPICRCAPWPAICRTARTRQNRCQAAASSRASASSRRALHGGGQRLGHRRRRDPAHGAGKDPAGAGDRAREQAALHPPGRKRRART